MKYKLYKHSENNTSNVIMEVLKNRGVTDYKTYLNLSEDVIIDYKRLENIDLAVNIFMKHYELKNKIYILVDEDPDGYCSASMMYLYIKRLDEEYPVDYILHKKAKSHGLSEDVVIPKDAKLLIIPDASTNDIDECKKLKDSGIDVLILDHHESEKENPFAVIVNNQMSKDYPNKDLCGAGIVYKFLKALDEETWNEYADDFLDLCALANISDVMDMRSFETRYLTNLGLLNIKNKALQAFISAQEYSMCGKVNIHNIQWYITPVLNGCIRIGSNEEKELLFKAFIEQDEFFEYKKRATKNKPAEVVKESIYDRAARLSKNAKSRQDKSKEKGVIAIKEVIGNLQHNDKVIILDVTNIIDNSLTGVIAIKIAEQYNKPCILLRKHYDKNLNKIVYGGSARNVDHSPINSFKDIVNQTNVMCGKGHANAFGIVNLNVDDKEKALQEINDILKDVIYDSTYRVDFVVDVDDVRPGFVIDFSCFEDIVCQGIDDPMIAVENIKLTKDCFEIFDKNEDTISFMYNDIKYIQFKCKEGNQLYDFLQNAWDDDDFVEFNIVGKPTVNEYNGVRTPQIIIEDTNVISISNSNNIDDDSW